MVNKIYFNWEQLGTMIETLANDIEKSGSQYDGVYGIPKGGMAIAQAIAYKLDLPLLLYPTINSLICDDISDTGKTLKSFNYKHSACLFSTDWTAVVPQFFIKKKLNKNDWIDFAWEMNQC